MTFAASGAVTWLQLSGELYGGETGASPGPFAVHAAPSDELAGGNDVAWLVGKTAGQDIVMPNDAWSTSGLKLAGVSNGAAYTTLGTSHAITLPIGPDFPNRKVYVCMFFLNKSAGITTGWVANKTSLSHGGWINTVTGVNEGTSQNNAMAYWQNGSGSGGFCGIHMAVLAPVAGAGVTSVTFTVNTSQNTQCLCYAVATAGRVFTRDSPTGIIVPGATSIGTSTPFNSLATDHIMLFINVGNAGTGVAPNITAPAGWINLAEQDQSVYSTGLFGLANYPLDINSTLSAGFATAADMGVIGVLAKN